MDFISRREAENAFEALRHSHLLGRHIILEWAEEKEGLEELREKVKAGFGDGKDGLPGQKRKLILGDEDEDGDGDV